MSHLEKLAREVMAAGNIFYNTDEWLIRLARAIVEDENPPADTNTIRLIEAPESAD